MNKGFFGSMMVWLEVLVVVGVLGGICYAMPVLGAAIIGLILGIVLGCHITLLQMRKRICEWKNTKQDVDKLTDALERKWNEWGDE